MEFYRVFNKKKTFLRKFLYEFKVSISSSSLSINYWNLGSFANITFAFLRYSYRNINIF